MSTYSVRTGFKFRSMMVTVKFAILVTFQLYSSIIDEEIVLLVLPKILDTDIYDISSKIKKANRAITSVWLCSFRGGTYSLVH